MQNIIFGAQGYALGAYKALKTIYPRYSISYFVVSAMEKNANILAGISVIDVNEVSGNMSKMEKENTQILIATPENVHPEIEEILENNGFRNYCRLTSDRWAELMKLYHVKLGLFLPVSALPIGSHDPFLRMYVAKSHKDTPLASVPDYPDYMISLQTGADLTDVKISALGDKKGEHISYKNGNYSELTGLYWIWKNKLGKTEHENGQYYGLSQYRRILQLSKDDLLRLVDNDVDVVLPYPMPYEPDIHAHHERYIKKEDWEAMVAALGELSPEYADAFSQVLGQQYFYNYNVILAKKSVLREYCEWLFPILERTEELSVPQGKDRADRYIGYMGETLETLYFMKNRDRLNVVHTGCRLLT